MLYRDENHRKSAPIKITYYVSPHEFWFKYLDKSEEHEELGVLERVLGNLSSKNLQRCTSPKIGEIVIVYCCFLNRYIRARVDYEFNYSTGSEFVLWAIDEGYPIQSISKSIFQLPSQELKHDNPHVYKATLNRVVPANSKYDFLEAKPMMVRTKYWSVKAKNEFEKILNAESLIFHYDCHVAKQHLYGSVEVITVTGKSVYTDELLKNLEEAVASTNFEKDYQRLDHKDYWFQQQDH